jgi:fructose/tagatose bisphosphate aldolase
LFPGNVGGNEALAQVVKNWSRPARPSTRDLLLEAEKGSYAVGAFIVYNFEAVSAVVAAAEAEKSPAILQIYPSALKHGGLPLVACCVSAAEHAAVPITVHIDHATDKQELMEAMEIGVDSVMVDGSHLPFSENVSYTKMIQIFVNQERSQDLNICLDTVRYQELNHSQKNQIQQVQCHLLYDLTHQLPLILKE